jgi:hypothetical protein
MPKCNHISISAEQIRCALRDDGTLVPPSRFNFAGLLCPSGVGDPIATLFAEDSFEARWFADIPHTDYGERERELNAEYCAEIEAIARLIAPGSAPDHPVKPLADELRDGAARISRAMNLWERHVVPIRVVGSRFYVIRQSNYLMQEARIRSVDAVQFARLMLLHCAAIRDTKSEELRRSRREAKWLALFLTLTAILLIISLIA